MWRLYAPGNEGVAVATTFGRLLNLVNGAPTQAHWLIGAGRVTYLDHFSDGLVNRLGQLPGDLMQYMFLMPYMLKNISYEHEKEVRALIATRQHEFPREGFDLPLNVIDFFDEIVINPFCQPWFNKAVDGVVRHYGLENKLRETSLSPHVFYIDRRKS
jgi:hypothetical protein